MTNGCHKPVDSAVDIHFWIHFSCDLIGPGQTKTIQGWPRGTGTNQIATRKFLRSGHIEVQNINIKSVCRQHSLIYLTYNISTDISSLLSHSKNGLADSFQHIFFAYESRVRQFEGWRGYTCMRRHRTVCSLRIEFVDERSSPFTVLF